MLPSVSPRRTSTELAKVPVSARAGAGAGAVRGVSMRGGRSARGAGAAGAGRTPAWAAAGCAGDADEVAPATGATASVRDAPPSIGSRVARTSGGSSRKVYSRTNLPLAQFSSSSRSTKGSLIGWMEVIRTKVRAPRGSIAKRRFDRVGLNSSPACLKASGWARRADSDCASSRLREVTSTSARSG